MSLFREYIRIVLQPLQDISKIKFKKSAIQAILPQLYAIKNKLTKLSIKVDELKTDKLQKADFKEKLDKFKVYDEIMKDPVKFKAEVDKIKAKQ